MQIVAGTSPKGLNPRVWDKQSPYYLPELRAVMVSYADFYQLPALRRRAMEGGIHQALGISKRIKIYLDNGAFYFSSRNIETSFVEYENFVVQAKPDWRPIPQDFIPIPSMTKQAQRKCFKRTMLVNECYQHDGFVPVIHISRVLEDYIEAVKSNPKLCAKPAIALGGIVPHLLRMPKAQPCLEILQKVQRVRECFKDKQLHLFGVGGTVTLHIAALLGMDSVDSSGWRNRAARGIVQLPGSGERMVAELGSWRGRIPSPEEWERLRTCQCPACQQYGLEGLKARKIYGFSNRATHNLWTLLKEAKWIEKHLKAGTYKDKYKEHLDNSIFRPIVEQLVKTHL
ncbi:MAG: hypothetical protein ABR577_03665 [Pyrinomonadaceae bacterium]